MELIPFDRSISYLFMGLQSFPNLITLDYQDMLDLVFIHTIFLNIFSMYVSHNNSDAPLYLSELHQEILIEGIKSLLASRISSY
jgi:hypothetical protein